MAVGPKAVALAVAAPDLKDPLYPAFLVLAARLAAAGQGGGGGGAHAWEVDFAPLARPKLFVTSSLAAGQQPEPAAARTYLAIAAGSGITPVMSLARTLLSQESRSEFVLIYGNRTSQSIIFKDALDDLKDRFLERFTVHHVLSREQQELPLLNGRIDASKIEALVGAIAPAAEIDHVFLCGPGVPVPERPGNGK